MNKQFDRRTQDVGNFLALEHVNVTVPDQEVAALFYITGLGFTRDPYIDFGTLNFWVNVGSQQFHLPKSTAQVFRGRVGLVVPDLAALEQRLGRLQKVFGDRVRDTKFAWSRSNDGRTVHVTCPWGNALVVHEASDAFGGITLGMPYVELDVSRGTAQGIARFYNEVIETPTRVERDYGGDRAIIKVGRAQEMIFRETDRPIPEYDGHHVAIYLANFSRPYDALLSRGLVSMETNEHEYRFQNIVDLDTGAVLATIEHEVRSMFHPMFDRELVNRNSAQSFFGYRAGHDAFVGIAHGGRG